MCYFMQAVIKQAGADAIMKVAKEQFPDTPEDQLPLSDMRLIDIASQASIITEVMKPKNRHFVFGLGKEGNGLMTKIYGSQRGSSSRTRLENATEEVEKAKEEEAKAKEEAAKAKEEAQKALEKASEVQAQLEATMEENKRLAAESSTMKDAFTNVQSKLDILM